MSENTSEFSYGDYVYGTIKKKRYYVRIDEIFTIRRIGQPDEFVYNTTDAVGYKRTFNQDQLISSLFAESLASLEKL